MSVNLPSDPYQLQQFLFPDVRFYDKQWSVIYSFHNNAETYVPAANMLGKDYLTAFCAVTEMLKHKECRGITTSVKDDHLRVLWDEIDGFLFQSSYPWDRENTGVLLATKGGPMKRNHRDIRMMPEHGYSNKSYLRGMVSETGEGLSGHHARDMAFLITDEASGSHDMVYVYGQGWMKKFLGIGNPNECQNYWRKACDAGDLPDPANPGRFLRKVIFMCAEDSPNVRLALEQMKRGLEPTNDIVTPGVLMWENGIKGYCYRRKHWDKIRQCVGLDGKFYVGPQLRLIDPSWFTIATNYGEKPWDGMSGRRPPPTNVFYLGIDPAEGGDDSSWVLIDKHGVILIESLPTADTNIIFGKTLDYIRKYNILPENVLFDRACGKAHADRLRAANYNVRTVDFGSIKRDPKRSIALFTEKRETHEERGETVNRRSEMYWGIRELLERPLEAHENTEVQRVIQETATLSTSKLNTTKMPTFPKFALPMPMCAELIRELQCVPLKYDELGRFKLIPKQDPKDDPLQPENQETFRYLIGRSPDVADAFALAVHGLSHKQNPASAGTR